MLAGTATAGLAAGALVAVVTIILLSLNTSGPLTPIKAIVLGAVEGFTEYLPVSSTGHLLVTQRLLGLGEGDAKAAADTYAIAIQIGAILAVVVLYWRRLGQLASGVIGRDVDGRKLLGRLVIAFVPAAVVGAAARRHHQGPAVRAVAGRRGVAGRRHCSSSGGIHGRVAST